MKKSDRIEAFLKSVQTGEGNGFDRRYLAYFECFNNQLYYEAHDVLEDLWLQERRHGHPSTRFFQGLIQLAGAFVHLKKQAARPRHPTDGRRLRPAYRLLGLAEANLRPFAPRHWGVDVEELLHFCENQRALLEKGDFNVNPYSPREAPRLNTPL